MSGNEGSGKKTSNSTGEKNGKIEQKRKAEETRGSEDSGSGLIGTIFGSGSDHEYETGERKWNFIGSASGSGNSGGSGLEENVSGNTGGSKGDLKFKINKLQCSSFLFIKLKQI